MANLINVPYEQIKIRRRVGQKFSGMKAMKKTLSDIIFMRSFQESIYFLREKFGYLQKDDKRPKSRTIGFGLDMAKSLSEAITVLCDYHNLSPYIWHGTLLEFVKSGEINLPKETEYICKDDKVPKSLKINQHLKTLYENDRVGVNLTKIRESSNPFEPSNILGVSVLINKFTRIEDLTEAFKHIERAQKRYLGRKDGGDNTHLDPKMVNDAFYLRKDGLSRSDIIKKFKDEYKGEIKQRRLTPQFISDLKEAAKERGY